MPISAGFLRAEVIDAPCEIVTWALFALPPGAAVVDVRKAADLAAFNAGAYTSICGAHKPTIGGGASLAQGDALTLWTDAKLDAGNVVVYVVESCDSGVAALSPRLLTRKT
jgi:hypothetical protein